MLLTRVVTAVCLLIVILPILFFAPPAGLVGLVTVFAALAAWEWGRLVRLPGGWGPVLYAVVVVLLTIAWYDIPPAAMSACCFTQTLSRGSWRGCCWRAVFARCKVGGSWCLRCSGW